MFLPTKYSKMNRAFSQEDGFTLIELVVAMAIVAIVTGGALLVFQSGMSISNKSMDRAAAQGAARQALSLIEEEIRESQTITKTDGAALPIDSPLDISILQFTRTNRDKVVYAYNPLKKEISQQVNGSNRLLMKNIDKLNVVLMNTGMYRIQLESTQGKETVQFSVYVKPRIL